MTLYEVTALIRVKLADCEKDEIEEMMQSTSNWDDWELLVVTAEREAERA